MKWGCLWQSWKQADPAEVQARVERASAHLRRSGAHYVIETVADLPAIIQDIQARLGTGRNTLIPRGR